MKKPETNEVLMATVTAVIVLLIGFLTGKGLDMLSFKALGIGIGVFIVIVFGIVALVLILQNASQQQELGDLSESHRNEVALLSASHRQETSLLVERLRALIPPPKFNWLLSDDDIARIEGEVRDHSDIWIVSPDLVYDVVEGNFQEVTKENFARGITYTYIVPNSPLLRQRVSVLRKVYEAYPAQVKIRQVPESDFRLLAVASIDVYDPNSERARAFLQLPVEQRGYWIEMSRDDAHSLIGRFREIAEIESK